MLRLAVIIGLLSVLPGCAIPAPPPDPTHQEITQAEYGPRISLQDAQTQATAFLRSRFKEPEPTEIAWTSIHDHSWLRDEGKIKFGYMLPAAVISARERYGGYFGFQFFFVQGTLTGIAFPDEQDSSLGPEAHHVASRKVRIY